MVAVRVDDRPSVQGDSAAGDHRGRSSGGGCRRDRCAVIALVSVVASVLCDALDGAVALAAGRVSRLGSVADKIADRIADSAFALVVWQCGAPLWLALIAGSSTLIVEGVRVARGGVALARITVAERPTRAICTVLACGSAAVSTAAWPPTVCAAVWAVLGLVGIVQVATA